MTRSLLRVCGTLVLAGVLIGPSARAQVPQSADQHARPAYGHTTSEWMMMGPHCGASFTG